MKAIRVNQTGGTEVLNLEEVAMPVLGQGQLLVRVHAVGVNPVETYIRAGAYGPVKVPYTPGSDGAGVVEKVGEKVQCFKAGDRVYLSGSVTGTYAEYCLAEESQVHLLPEHVTFGQGAAMGVPYATAYYALFYRGHGNAGEVVLVHGASGGVGTAAVQLARNAGLTVIGTAGTEMGMKLVMQLGAMAVLNHKTPGYLEELGRLTSGKGPDLILEMLANVNLQNDLKVLAKKGRVVVIGSRGSIEIDPRLTMGKGTSILGMSLFNATAEELAAIHAALAYRTGPVSRGFRGPLPGQPPSWGVPTFWVYGWLGGRAFGMAILAPACARLGVGNRAQLAARGGHGANGVGVYDIAVGTDRTSGRLPSRRSARMQRVIWSKNWVSRDRVHIGPWIPIHGSNR